MRSDVDLRLLLTSLRRLALTPYFDHHVLEYSNHLCRVIDFALKANPAVPEPALRRLASIVWTAHKYLSGSISREAPYEVQYCLELALKDWAKKQCIITTGLLDGPYEYHFYQLDPWHQVRVLFPNFDAQGFDRSLVLVGLPRLYQHKPIFCIPLYHELGHFVDRHWGVTNLIAIWTVSGVGLTRGISLSQPHWAEHFADLFAACYVGSASVGVLETIAPHNPASVTHPATVDRMSLVKNFLNGIPDLRIDVVRSALNMLTAPPLVLKYVAPNISTVFDDLRPAHITSPEELHGLFDAAWAYFSTSAANPISIWTGRDLDIEDLEKIVNDLTEKSIRNYSIRELWSVHAHP